MKTLNKNAFISVVSQRCLHESVESRYDKILLTAKSKTRIEQSLASISWKKHLQYEDLITTLTESLRNGYVLMLYAKWFNILNVVCNGVQPVCKNCMNPIYREQHST